MLVSALSNIVLHNSLRLHVSQWFHCVKTDNVHDTCFLREVTRFSAFRVIFPENRVKTQGYVCFSGKKPQSAQFNAFARLLVL